jgi:hypothetical protein
MGHPQVVRASNNTSTMWILMLSPLLYSLFTVDCVAKHDFNTIVKFADDTAVVGLITNNNETAFREEVRDLAVWCHDNNISLNTRKTKEMCICIYYGSPLPAAKAAAIFPGVQQN